jgi:hypothetical protein
LCTEQCVGPGTAVLDYRVPGLIERVPLAAPALH